jgi:hypothetical protein
MSYVAASILHCRDLSNVTHKIVVPDFYGGVIGTWEIARAPELEEVSS